MRPITAKDLMNPEVLTVRETTSVRELATFLIDNEISGAPVEDEGGRLVGVVSLVDVAASASGSGQRVTSDQSNPDFYVRGFEDRLAPEEMHRFHVEDEELLVRDIMTPALYSVDQDATVSEIASMMLDGHLHRVLVTGEDPESVVGIISTSDLLGLLVEER